MKRLLVSSKLIDNTVTVENDEGDNETFDMPDGLDGLARVVYLAAMFGESQGFRDGYDSAKDYYENRKDYDVPRVVKDKADDIVDVKYCGVRVSKSGPRSHATVQIHDVMIAVVATGYETDGVDIYIEEDGE